MNLCNELIGLEDDFKVTDKRMFDVHDFFFIERQQVISELTAI